MRLILGTAIASLYLSTSYVVGQGKEISATERTRQQAAQVSEQDRKFWAFAPLRKVTPPKPRDTAWAKNPIDLFVRAAQEQHGLDPSPTASPRTLYRRASFALTGLPPDPDAADKFKPSAWTDTIDSFLATPQFGERWARHWLDVARFAESHGFEQDYNRPHAYHYRDFVIQALNRDLPFNTFVEWQIAGDELAPEQPLAKLATGFLGAGVFPTQLTEKEFERARYDELDDMVATIGAGMLGLSIGCARCHDHKYDPIPSNDYYQLLASFSTTIRSEIDVQMDPQADQLARAKWDQERTDLQTRLALYERQELPAKLAQFLTSEASSQTIQSPGWQILKPKQFKSSGGATSKIQEDDSILVTGKNPQFDTYTVVLDAPTGPLTALRVEALPDASMIRKGPGRAVNGNFCLTNITVNAAPASGPGKHVAVSLANAKATFSQRGLPVTAVIDNNRTSGWAVDPQFGKPQAAVFEFAKPVHFTTGTRLTVTLDFRCNNGHNIGRPRFSVTDQPGSVPLKLTGPPPSIIAALKASNTTRTKAQSKALIKWFRERDPGWQKYNTQLQKYPAPASSVSKVMVCTEGQKPIKHHADGRGFPHFYKSVHFLKRGDTNLKGPVMEPGFLQILTRDASATKRWQQAPPDNAKTPHRRAAVARWLTDVEDGAGSLLARVIVNRIWHHHFGTGIVATPNDFGSQGARPSHPELLEWLATELIRSGWRLKPIHRLIMTSATYQQSDRPLESEKLTKVDQWFGRYRPRRLEGESLRDALLQVSGVLDPTMFGAGSLNEASNRRSIYFMIKRSKLVPVMVTFDLPEPLTSQGQRTTTTVAPQALLLMNSQHVRRYATAFAKRAAKATDPVVNAYRQALGRPPTNQEHRAAEAFLASQADSYRPTKRAAASALALTDFCQVLFGLNEFAYVH